MRFIKPFLFGLIGLSILALLFSLIIPSNVHITRIVTIYAPTKKVSQQVTDITKWKNWHPAFKNDSAVITYTAKGCDILYHNKITKLEVINIDSTGIAFLLRSKGENDISNQIKIVKVAEPNTLAVEWKADIKLKWYPWEKIYGIFLDQIAGPGYEDALNSLKVYSEQN